MLTSELPDRIRFSRTIYTADPAGEAPPVGQLVRLGPEAEGRIVYGDPSQLNRRKRVFLLDGADQPHAYVRPDLPRGISIAQIIAESLGAQLDAEQAIVLRAILSKKHLVLVDGTRLSLRGRMLDDLVVRFSGHDWLDAPKALQKRALGRWEEVGTALQTHPYARRLADSLFGEVLSVAPEGATLSQQTRDPVDIGQELVVYVAPKRLKGEPKVLVPHPQTGEQAGLCYVTVIALHGRLATVQPVFPEQQPALEPGSYAGFAFYTSS